jgi:hypothetical protein
LPPNAKSPEGERWVTYTIRPRRDVNTSDLIDAEARIVFDINELVERLESSCVLTHWVKITTRYSSLRT